MKKPAKEHAASSAMTFERVAEAFASGPSVSRGGGKGFGSGALKVNGKIFAMISSNDEFVVKLPKDRVDELVSKGHAVRLDPGHGRLMKEWAVVKSGSGTWVPLAREACDFVRKSEK